jgi:trimethylamine--corrinoid protein Co-methyltransferase
MALSEAKEVDAQAGAETFGSALLAALAGVNSVSGPGMLDFLLVFSLPKLVLDDELCAQALHFVRNVRNLDDIPARALVDELLATQHLITSEHTSRYWPEELYLPGRVFDRDNRENWTKAGAPDTYRRAVAEVERRLAAYQPIDTDPLAEQELARIIKAGLVSQTELPFIPPAPARADAAAFAATGDAPRGRRANPRRGR